MIINFILFSAKLTGGTRVIMEVANGLVKRGHKVNIVTFSNPLEISWVNLKADVYHIHRSFTERVTGWLYRKVFGFQCWPEEETRKLIKAMPRCDINVATISYSGFAVSRSCIGTPFQYHMHYEPFVREDGYKKKIIEESYFLPTKKIANSTWLAKVIKEKTGQDVVGLALPAIDHDIFYPRKKDKKINKNGEIKIISLAKYKKWKGLEDALKAIELVRNNGYNINYITFGGQFDKKMLSNNVKNIDFTHIGLKINDELAEFYSEADILISPSYFESFPLPPIEAMACGTPVVTTRYGTEDYAFNRKNALVVEPKNPEMMADAIMELIENKNLYQEILKEGIKTAKSFTWDNTVNQIEKIFKESL